MRLLHATVPVTFHYEEQETTNVDGYRVKGETFVITRQCFVNTQGSRGDSTVDAEAVDTWDAEIGWYDNELSSDPSGKLTKVIVDELTLYPTSQLPHSIGVGGMRLGTDRWRAVKVSRVDRGRD